MDEENAKKEVEVSIILLQSKEERKIFYPFHQNKTDK